MLLSNTLKIRHFDRLSTGTVRAKAQFRLRRELSRTIRPSLTPALRLGLVSTRPTGALALMAQQHEVVHVIYCQSLRRISTCAVIKLLRDSSVFQLGHSYMQQVLAEKI